MKYIPIFFLLLACAQKKECKHIYVSVVPAYIDAKENVLWSDTITKLDIIFDWDEPKGKHELGDIVCVKCFHIIKQIIDYGNKGFWRTNGDMIMEDDTTVLGQDSAKLIY